MNLSISGGSIEHYIEQIAHSLVEAFLALDILRGLRVAAQAPTFFTQFACAHDAINRVAFDSLFIRVGRVIDTSADTFTFPGLITHFRKEWIDDSSRTLALDEVSLAFACVREDTLGKLTRWRNKVIAHRTNKVGNLIFYEANKLSIDEVETALVSIQNLFNDLCESANNSTHDCTSASLRLQGEVQQLFGLEG